MAKIRIMSQFKVGTSKIQLLLNSENPSIRTIHDSYYLRIENEDGTVDWMTTKFIGGAEAIQNEETFARQSGVKP